MSNKKMEEAIKDRLETGFKNWNGGYESWLVWCNTLYDDASMYNVYGHRLTLKQYQDMMGDLFAKQDIFLGKFHNMIIQDDWCAIRYDVETVDKATGKRETQESMEFVHFKETPTGVKVDEGWATSTSPLHGA
ncbi:nuclear transport factor 2 family protein [Fusibacter paucivorans]|uniref:Nuclear transport factor 2 family protein n=1 Tax=Fusibacter paucivorans TaxID=76009 RepID=A0ABS5PRN5_9FIRM|nr:nuclear transport factor 2 family protein [Fusibacter paucivorans]MBS7527829.1 nuclear transport factor 2 family protein [Fusibacter paucivorans]